MIEGGIEQNAKSQQHQQQQAYSACSARKQTISVAVESSFPAGPSMRVVDAVNTRSPLYLDLKRFR